MSDSTVHVPVLLDGVLAQLGNLSGKKVVDGTFGGGGYTSAFLQKGAHVIGIDRDPRALARGSQLQEKYADSLALVNSTFADLADALDAQGWEEVDAIVLDLGLSSDQLDTPERGFGYQNDGPLDMRMGSTGKTAADLLNQSKEPELADIFYHYGDEPKARPLAKYIVHIRQEQPIETTKQLLEIVEHIYPPRKGLNRRHPAQRIFQALRIAVNDELKQVEGVIPIAASRLSVGGKLAIVTFHSIEDRLVKKGFRDLCEPELDMLGREVSPAKFKQPVRKVVPTDVEIENNVRARSAILRVLERVGS